MKPADQTGFDIPRRVGGDETSTRDPYGIRGPSTRPRSPDPGNVKVSPLALKPPPDEPRRIPGTFGLGNVRTGAVPRRAASATKPSSLIFQDVLTQSSSDVPASIRQPGSAGRRKSKTRNRPTSGRVRLRTRQPSTEFGRDFAGLDLNSCDWYPWSVSDQPRGRSSFFLPSGLPALSPSDSAEPVGEPVSSASARLWLALSRSCRNAAGDCVCDT